jgi:hypothetical protein
VQLGLQLKGCSYERLRFSIEGRVLFSTKLPDLASKIVQNSKTVCKTIPRRAPSAMHSSLGSLETINKCNLLNGVWHQATCNPPVRSNLRVAFIITTLASWHCNFLQNQSANTGFSTMQPKCSRTMNEIESKGCSQHSHSNDLFTTWSWSPSCEYKNATIGFQHYGIKPVTHAQ